MNFLILSSAGAVCLPALWCESACLLNGKVYYFAGNSIKKDAYLYDYALYVNDKKVSDNYSAYTDVNVKNGVLTFIASKGSDIYSVEVKP